MDNILIQKHDDGYLLTVDYISTESPMRIMAKTVFCTTFAQLIDRISITINEEENKNG